MIIGKRSTVRPLISTPSSNENQLELTVGLDGRDPRRVVGDDLERERVVDLTLKPNARSCGTASDANAQNALLPCSGRTA